MNAAKKLAMNGMLLALSMTLLYLKTVIPSGKLSLYVLSSFIISIVVIEFGVKSAWIFYMTSCLLALAIIPDKIAIIPYIIFFGIYGIVKYHIEKINMVIMVYIMKLVCFNIYLIVSFFFIKNLFYKDLSLDNLPGGFPVWTIVLLLEAVFIIYDYVYTLFIQYYKIKIKKILKI